MLVADAGDDQTLGCSTVEVMLDGTASTVSASHRYTWEDATGNIIAQGISTVIESPGLYTLIVTNTENGCFSEDEVLVSLNEDRPQIAELRVTDPKCYGDRDGAIEILSISGGTAPYTYRLEDEAPILYGNFSNLYPGQYLISIEDAEGCKQDTVILIGSGTDLQVELGRDRTILLGASTNLEALLNIPPGQVSDIRWVTSEGEICSGCIEWLVTPQFTTTYSVYVQDENGCLTEDVVTVFVDKTRRVFIPNAFSPNNDGPNDVFMIFADRDVARIRDFKILDRWGELVFQQEDFQPNNPAHGWNGMFRGQMFSPQVFVYLAEIEFIDGEIIIYKGSVHLVR
ncbi:MAG: gliding motility-associated C-terminal domain-containing protein [Saprospiraceae bacterium]|nr:gliding motility-associated C-terminal domain-containing protein [Saprospiraceae bacterium]